VKPAGETQKTSGTQTVKPEEKPKEDVKKQDGKPKEESGKQDSRN